MFNLSDINLSYILVSPENSENLEENKFLCTKLCNILYSKNYVVIPIKEYYNNVYKNSFIAIKENNDLIRKDAIYLIEELSQDYIIIKYKGESIAKKLLNDGSEKLLDIVIYESESNVKKYLYDGLSFSFLDQKRYQIINNKSQLKKGMIVEFFNNDKWIEKEINDIDIEYEKMYKLLIKYNKLRVCTG